MFFPAPPIRSGDVSREKQEEVMLEEFLSNDKV